MLLDQEVALDQQVYSAVEQIVAGGTWALAAVYSLSEKIVPEVVGLAHPQSRRRRRRMSLA
jgi:hypothetical protein